MADRAPRNDDEVQSRKRAIALAKEMLARRLSFFEGAAQMWLLQSRIGGINERDPDFDAFMLICSETDHLPLAAQQHLWSAPAIEGLKSEFVRTEEWAQSFAPQACENIIARFGGHDS